MRGGIQMASPFWQCPKCHKLTRKAQQFFELVELGMGESTGVVGPGLADTTNCANCGASFTIKTIYIDAKYDVSIKDVFNGKYGAHIVENIRQLHKAGKINLTEEEKNLLFKGKKKSLLSKIFKF